MLAGYYGTGAIRSGHITEFLLGVPVKGEGQRPVRFDSFCKVGTGMTLDETNSMHAQMTWHDWDKESLYLYT